MQPGAATRTSQASISAALAVASAQAARIPAQDGHSLAEMAQRDLDAALQLLADRAQYITGSSGAAIALRRRGKKDMLCRASAGSNAPELGALLSTEVGLSGESVRTRQLLRCDDVDRDTRVNREACRQLGIASVAVMPVVNDDEVLGVFELFSGKVNAFGERDLTALRRLSELVETAVKLSRAAEQVPEQLVEQLRVAETPAGEAAVLEVDEAEPKDLAFEVEAEKEVEAEFVADAVLPEPAPANPPKHAERSAGAGPAAKVQALPTAAPATPTQKPVGPEPAPKSVDRPLLWSIALDPVPNAAAEQPEQAQVPATLKNLRKCQACGFPVSPGRTLCVECEEKKWRGQVTARSSQASMAAGAAAAAPARAPERIPAVAPVKKPSEHAKGASASAKTPQPAPQAPATESLGEQGKTSTALDKPQSPPELVLSAAMGPPQSWLSAHKFVILTLLGAAAGAVILLSR